MKNNSKRFWFEILILNLKFSEVSKSTKTKEARIKYFGSSDMVVNLNNNYLLKRYSGVGLFWNFRNRRSYIITDNLLGISYKKATCTMHFGFLILCILRFVPKTRFIPTSLSHENVTNRKLIGFQRKIENLFVTGFGTIECFSIFC